MAALKKLTRASLLRGVEELASRDPDLAATIEKNGPPPMWGRKEGFAALVKIILEQQVSLASAEAVFLKLESTVSVVTPERILDLSGDGLRSLGFTRQKAACCEGLAESMMSGRLDLASLSRLSDEDAHSALVSIKGIGPWTANIYLLMALRRPDIWPSGDLALAESIKRLKGLENRPAYDEQLDIAGNWKPWRSVAARILWNDYLS